MTDVSNLDDLANKIANSSPNIKKYAQAQAAATQSQEAELVKLREDVEMLKRSVSDPPDGGVDPGGGTPGPPPNGVPLFDGRATRMTSLTGSTVKIGDPTWTTTFSTARQSPMVWGEHLDNPNSPSGLYFMTDSISLVADATYTKVYRYNMGPGDTNPYLDLPTKPNGELTTARSVTPGQVDWYAEAFKIVSPFSPLSWHVICQYGYPSITSPPLAIGCNATQLGIDRNVGAITNGVTLQENVLRPKFYNIADIIDKWVEIIVGVQWQFDTAGWLYVYCRVKANGDTGFTLKYSDTTKPTGQYRTGSAFPTSVNDKQSLYFGEATNPPTNTVLHRGFTRWLSYADALASMGS